MGDKKNGEPMHIIRVQYGIRRNFRQMNFLSCIKDCIEGMHGDLYRIGKNYFHKHFLQYERSWTWRIFIQQQFSHIDSSMK